MLYLSLLYLSTNTWNLKKQQIHVFVYELKCIYIKKSVSFYLLFVCLGFFACFNFYFFFVTIHGLQKQFSNVP